MVNSGELYGDGTVEPQSDPVAVAEPEKAEAEADVEPQPDAESDDGAEPAGDKAEAAPKAEKADDDGKDAYAALALAKDSPLDAEALPGIKAFAAELGLNAEQAGKLLAAEEARVEAAHAEYDSHVEGWKAELAKQLGSQWDEADRDVTALVTKYGPPGTLEILKDSGYAVHPIFFGLMHNIAKAFSSPKDVVRAPTAKSGPLSDDDQWARDYPKSGPMPSRAKAGMSVL